MSIEKITQQKFATWYEANKPPEGMYNDIQLRGLKALSEHAYFQGVLDGSNYVMNKRVYDRT